MDWIVCWVWVWGVWLALAIGAMAVITVVKAFEVFLGFQFGADLSNLRYDSSDRRFRTLKTKYIKRSGGPQFHSG